MIRVAKAPTMTSPRALHYLLTVAIAGAVLLAGCSSSASHSARHAGTTQHTTTSTSAKATPTTTTTVSTTATTAPATTYRVKRGDRLTRLAKRLHVPVAAIVSFNHLASPDRLTEGQVLKIPSTPPLMLVITPPAGPPGQNFQLDLTGLKPAEVITFEIDSAAGKHTGKPHIASADGEVKSTYQASVTGSTGTYKVIASGSKGTTTQASFRVVKK